LRFGRLVSIAILLAFCEPLSQARSEEVRYPGQAWERVRPSESGWSQSALRRARDHFNEMGSTALLVVHDGRVVAAWGDTDEPIKIHSARKSIMSALFGIAVAAGKIALNRTVGELGIDDYPPSLTRVEKQATVRDLLQARSGVYHEAAAETRNMKKRRPKRGSHAPGTFWYYNNWDFNVLGTILRNATGEDTFAAVERNFARPLQMQRFSARDGEYVRIRASQHPAYHMKFTALDLARFGWLFLNQGRWRDRQVIPAAWVAESTKPWTSEARSGIAYGYMWWVAEGERHFRADVGPGSFSARGSGGQYVIVAPARRTVIVHLNDHSEVQRVDRGDFNRLMRLIFAAAPH
jgi:CubicO group peptidase (beta-lactamase class C family)